MLKNLTFRYSITQFSFWCASTGAASFASTYLVNCGLSYATIGILLACAGLLSSLTQPFLASFADRSQKFILVKMMLFMSLLCCVCFSIQLIPQLPLLLVGLFYALGVWASDVMIPLTNALFVTYNQGDYSINYGLSRGIGSIASALSSLIIGFLIIRFGSIWMIFFLLIFRIICIFTLIGYPAVEKTTVLKKNTNQSCSILEFFAKYKWYCSSLAGILFLGMFHAMTENYLVAVMERLGGNSSNVGTALFISATTGAFVIFIFSNIRKRINDNNLLRLLPFHFL